MDSFESDKTVQSLSAGRPGAGERRCPACRLEVTATTLVCPQDGTAIVQSAEMELSKLYEFISVTGHGGMSIIYKAKQKSTGDLVAIKMLHTFVLNEAAFRRFQLEAQAIRSLRHPNIISVHDFGLSEHGQPYMVMDFIQGKNLAQLLAERGVLSVDESVPRFLQICDALQHAHNRGILHRDLKPSNIMLSSDDGSFEDARIVDFGIAKLMDKQNDGGTLTRTGDLFGSPLYMSPEQCRGTGVDVRSDIYSMGCVMYEVLTGRPPLHGATIMETILMHLGDVPLLMSEACPDKSFPPGLESVVAKALAKDPEERFRSMKELKLQLMQINLDSPPVQTHNKAPQKTWNFKHLKFIAVCAAWFLFGAMLTTTMKIKVQPTVETEPASAQMVDGRFSSRVAPEREQDPHAINEQVAAFLDSPSVQKHQSALYLNGRLSLNDTGTAKLRLLKAVQTLTLDNTMIEDGTLESIPDLPVLKELSLSGTMCSDAGVKKLGKLVNLQKLDLSHTDITDESMQKIGQFRSLNDLALSDTAITDKGLSYLQGMRLKRLALGHTQITDAGLNVLAGMTSLRYLELQDTPITDAGLEKLKNLNALVQISLTHTQITDRGLQSLVSSSPHIDMLRASAANVTDDGVAQLQKLTMLNSLDLSDSKITDKCMPMIGQMSHLKILFLNKTKITDAGLVPITQLKHLTTLSLNDTQITNEGVKTLGKLHGLQELSMFDCPRVRGSNNQMRKDLHTTLIWGSRYKEQLQLR